MLIANNLDKKFKNNSIVFVDCKVAPTKTVNAENAIFLVNDKNEVHSINVLNNDAFGLSLNNKFYGLSHTQTQTLSKLAESLGLVLKNEPKFIYAKVISREVHPKSDKLFVLQMDKGDGKLIQLVTNTLDSEQGKVLVMALPGSTTFSGLEIKTGKVMDVDSFGMLTGYKTLGVEKEGLIFGTNELIGKDYQF
ncbi:TyrS-associated PheT N-terminal domain-related protein TapR [Mycoplasma corogypsi]|uniref:TyrS-associated PheT N-terminal domain-related protein TapR n=1 Tax=Mycoplasma corogypsi TaxID=2106 RepID=UPI003872E7BA